MRSASTAVEIPPLAAFQPLKSRSAHAVARATIDTGNQRSIKDLGNFFADST
jgi:hypothetical protein